MDERRKLVLQSLMCTLEHAMLGTDFAYSVASDEGVHLHKFVVELRNELTEMAEKVAEKMAEK